MSVPHYEQIADEISQGQIDRGLWIQAFAACGGNDGMARAQYIKMRLRKLRGWSLFDARRSPRGPHQPGAATTVVRRFGADLWTAWLWTWTFAFAALTALGLLCLVTMLRLHLVDDGAVAWPFLTVGGAFMTFFLFGRGVQCLLARPPTVVFYTLEILALSATIWLVAGAGNPAVLGHVPRTLSNELVFLLCRFLGSADRWANVVTTAVFFLPVYGMIAFLRQQKV